MYLPRAQGLEEDISAQKATKNEHRSGVVCVACPNFYSVFSGCQISTCCCDMFVEGLLGMQVEGACHCILGL